MTRHVAKMTLYVVCAPAQNNHQIRVLSRIDGSRVDKQNRDVILNGIDATTDSTLQTLPILFEDQRLLANRADENIEKILGNHGALIVTLKDIG